MNSAKFFHCRREQHCADMQRRVFWNLAQQIAGGLGTDVALIHGPQDDADAATNFEPHALGCGSGSHVVTEENIRSKFLCPRQSGKLTSMKWKFRWHGCAGHRWAIHYLNEIRSAQDTGAMKLRLACDDGRAEQRAHRFEERDCGQLIQVDQRPSIKDANFHLTGAAPAEPSVLFHQGCPHPPAAPYFDTNTGGAHRRLSSVRADQIRPLALTACSVREGVRVAPLGIGRFSGEGGSAARRVVLQSPFFVRAWLENTGTPATRQPYFFSHKS